MADSVLARLQRLVELESPSGDVPRVTALAAVLAQELQRAGAAVATLEAPGYGAHVEAQLPGAQPELEPLLVLGHMDTVFPAGTLAERPFRVEDGRVLGPGVYDMKAGLAVLLEAIAGLRAAGARPRRPLRILVNCDEEVGSHTSRAHIERLAAGAAAALVLEPSLPGGAAKTARKGIGDYTIRVTGRAAHAGLEPQEGINAITELAHQVLVLERMAAPELGTTISVGLITGGTASNVIPAHASAQVDVRFTSAGEARRVDEALHALRPVLAGAAVKVEGGINRPPLERTEGVVALYQRARALAAELGFELGEGRSGGGSDGNLTAAAGVPTLDGLGPDGGGAHAVSEHVLVEDLPRRVELIRHLLQSL